MYIYERENTNMLMQIWVMNFPRQSWVTIQAREEWETPKTVRFLGTLSCVLSAGSSTTTRLCSACSRKPVAPGVCDFVSCRLLFLSLPFRFFFCFLVIAPSASPHCNTSPLATPVFVTWLGVFLSLLLNRYPCPSRDSCNSCSYASISPASAIEPHS